MTEPTKQEYLRSIIECLRDDIEAVVPVPSARFVTCSFQGIRAVLDHIAELEALVREFVTEAHYGQAPKLGLVNRAESLLDGGTKP